MILGRRRIKRYLFEPRLTQIIIHPAVPGDILKWTLFRRRPRKIRTNSFQFDNFVACFTVPANLGVSDSQVPVRPWSIRERSCVALEEWDSLLSAPHPYIGSSNKVCV